MNAKRTGGVALAVAALTGVVLATALVAFARSSQDVLPIPDRATQLDFEQQVEDFLAGNPGPVQTHAKDGTIASLNSFYEAEVLWWDAIPWEAVVGQWGCALGSYEASFNPADSSGVITAGYGVIADCGNALDTTGMAWVTSPVTRSSVIDGPPLLGE